MFESMALAATRLAEPGAIAMLLLGVVVGTTFGALPGLGSIVALSIALPFTFGMDPMLAMFLLAGIMSSVKSQVTATPIAVQKPKSRIMSTSATCRDKKPIRVVSVVSVHAVSMCFRARSNAVSGG